MKTPFIYRIFALGFAVSGSVAMAAFIPITNITFTTVVGPPDQFLLTTLTAGGTTFSAGGLGVGTSTGSPSSPTTPRMDNLNLNDAATGHAAPLDTVMFGGLFFTNQNGPLPDFFLFEAATFGNPDDITVAAIFLDDTVGVAVVAPTNYASGWGDTGFDFTGIPSSALFDIAGLCWDITDLKDAGGVTLAPSTPIKGIRIAGPQGSGIDPCAFLATAPAPPPANISYSQSGGILQLNWPAGQGWRLQSQTNMVTVGLSNNWGNVSDATLPPYDVPVNPANATVFYRLVWP